MPRAMNHLRQLASNLNDLFPLRPRRTFLEPLHILLLSICGPFHSRRRRMECACFVRSLFQAGQMTPVNDCIDPSTLMPSAKSVRNALQQLGADSRNEYKGGLLQKIYETGGGVTTDGVTLKVQDRQFQDLTNHYIHICGSTLLNSEPKAEMKVVTLLLKEKPEFGDAATIRQTLGTHLKTHYGKDIDWLTKRFTMVTDCASVMARVALSSVSPRVAPMDEKWMGCLAHQINTAMKSCMSSLSENPDLQIIFSNIQNVKIIVRIFKQSGWNAFLPNGFHLIQECETRFATTFTVVERFIKSAEKVKAIIDRKSSNPAKDAFANLKIESGGSRVLRFPALQVIVDAFHVLIDTQTKVQAANTPTIHLALPLLHRCMEKLDRISDGGSIWRDNEAGLVPSSRLARKLCRNLMEWLDAKIRVHPLWLVGCFLHPLLREFQFVNGVDKSQEYRSRGEQLLRTLIASYKPTASAENSQDTQTVTQASVSTDNVLSGNFVSSDPTVVGGKRTFSLIEYADSHFQPTVVFDEVSRYNSMDISVLCLDRKNFMDDDFSTIKFWYHRKGTYPSLFKAACRVYATPVSSCASERVFSALNRVVSRDRASTSPETLEDILIVRSMM